MSFFKTEGKIDNNTEHGEKIGSVDVDKLDAAIMELN
jgi:hypothetical protein